MTDPQSSAILFHSWPALRQRFLSPVAITNHSSPAAWRSSGQSPSRSYSSTSTSTTATATFATSSITWPAAITSPGDMSTNLRSSRSSSTSAAPYSEILSAAFVSYPHWLLLFWCCKPPSSPASSADAASHCSSAPSLSLSRRSIFPTEACWVPTASNQISGWAARISLSSLLSATIPAIGCGLA